MELGERRPPAGRGAGPPPDGCRLMVDEAHATGALGRAGARLGRRRRPQRRGRRRRRHPRQGARLLRRLRLRQRRDVDFLLNTARPFIFSTAPPPPSVAAAGGGAGAARSPRTGSSACRRTPRVSAPPSPPRASGPAARETQIVPIEVGEAEPTMELCERAARARRLRPGDPPADRPRGLLAPALHGDGDPPRRGARARPRSWSAGPPASSASRPGAPLAAIAA